MKRFSKKILLDNIRILDVASDFSISLESASSGNFDYRCKCPNPEHKSGFERTGSCYIDSKNNNFYCFGCNANNNVIDFYMLCSGESFSQSLDSLSEKINPSNIKRTSDNIKGNNFSILMEISNTLRESLKKNQDDFEWHMKLFKKVDAYIDSISVEDKKKSSALLNRVKKELARRYF